MEKILKPHTIVPEDLYVQRDADRQVERIIEDMGRPGYVLVSRQMGKTNLLINAKNKLERANDAFVYIDLSNTFPTARGCFENIIDNAIEAYPEKFSQVSELILERRAQLTDTPPHKQHTNELRFLLQSLKGGKMVIILDEIDALTKTDYSDQIFSQIRSTYFGARVNYKEFYHLTYLLSGVVEPNEIIKDPRVSPFNIGQKIYLNDFSRDEFNNFTNTAHLKINQESRDRIFYWTNGNPRISWDVCSEVETLIKTQDCSTKDIDKIVQDLYLTSFDRAPIDNIREIISNDREIRNSIVEIEYKKGKSVSDKIKSKLYLAGIINYDEDDIHIKNEIIRKSLSLAWIRSLEEMDKGLLAIAMEEYTNRRYKDSLLTFNNFLLHSELPDTTQKPHYLYAMGYCAFSLKDYDNAIKYFDKALFDEDEEPKYYYALLYYKGITYSYLNNIESCLKNLKTIIDNGIKDKFYAMSLVNYGLYSSKSGIQNHKEDAIRIFNEIIDESAFKKDKLDKNFINNIKAISQFALAEIAIADNDEGQALSRHLEAISLAESDSKPKYLLSYFKINKNKKENFELLSALVESIVDGSLIPSVEDSESSMGGFTLDIFRQVLIFTILNYREELLHKLIPKLSMLGDYTLQRHIYELAIFSINTKGDWDEGVKILEYNYSVFNKNQDKNDLESQFNTLKLLSFDLNSVHTKNYINEYTNLFLSMKREEVDLWDINIFITLIRECIEKNAFSDALKYSKSLNSYRNNAPDDTLISFLLISYLELSIYHKIGDDANSLLKAKEVMTLLNNEKVQAGESHLLDEDSLNTFEKNAQYILNKAKKSNLPAKGSKVYGRNQLIKVRYKDGTILETKYKKVEDDINEGNCMILQSDLL